MQWQYTTILTTRLNPFFCSAFAVSVSGLVGEFRFAWENSRSRCAMNKLLSISHRPSMIFCLPDVYERCQEFNLLILVWLLLREQRFSLSAYRIWNLPHVYRAYWFRTCAAASAIPMSSPKRSSVCWDCSWLRLDSNPFIVILNLSLLCVVSPLLSLTSNNVDWWMSNKQGQL